MPNRDEFERLLKRVLATQGIPSSKVDKDILKTIEDEYSCHMEYQDAETLAEDAAIDVRRLLNYKERLPYTKSSKNKQNAHTRSAIENRRALEILRSNILQDYHWQRIKIDPHISAFRAAFLEGKTIPSQEKALAFLYSPANRYISVNEMVNQGVSFICHSAEILKDEIRFESNRLHSTSAFRLLEIGISPQNCVFQVKRYILADNNSAITYDSLPTLQYTAHSDSQGSKIKEVDYLPGSALDALRILCDKLLNVYSLTYPLLPWLILTDSFVPIQPIQCINPIGHIKQNRITMQVELWMSSKSVEQFYKQVQKQMCGCRSRPLGKKTLELFRFIWKRGEPAGRDGKWKKLLNDWNSEFPLWSYSSIRQFQRDYNERAKKPLITPDIKNKVFD